MSAMVARILVIEDNPANLELMTYLLKAFGYQTREACDGEEGLARLGEEVPDLIVCDIQLPGIDGYELARQLKGDPVLRSIPLVAVSALAMVGDRDKILAAGFDGYIAKPITPQTFVAQVAVFLPPEQRSEWRAPEPEASTAAHDTLRAPATGVTILVVDDLPSNIDFVRTVLEHAGYNVISAPNVHEGLQLAADAMPDLILSDVHMPEKNGYELVRAVKASPELQPIPFVFLASTPTSPRERQQAISLGAARFILRPIEPQALLDQIAQCLRDRKA